MNVTGDSAALGGASGPKTEQDRVLRGVSEEFQQKGFIVAKVDALRSWARTGSLWPMTFGLACCPVELMQTAASAYDLNGFGIVLGATPGQSAVVLLA